VQKIRMAAARDHDRCAGALLQARVPPMILAHAGGEAVKHGVGPLAEGGSIRVQAERAGDTLTCAWRQRPAASPPPGLRRRARTSARGRRALWGRAALRLEANSPRGVVATSRCPGGEAAA